MSLWLECWGYVLQVLECEGVSPLPADFHVPSEYLTNIHIRDKVCTKRQNDPFLCHVTDFFADAGVRSPVCS